MKFILGLLVMLASNSSFADWGGLEGSITRTSATPSVFRVQDNVQLYHTVCTEQETYGPDASCGTHESCTWDTDGNQTCSSEYNSCTHTYTSCLEEPSYVQTVTFDLIFDSRAPLAAGQTEKIEIDIDVNGGEVELETEVESKFYKYKDTKVKFQSNQVGQTSIVMTKKKN